MTNFVGFTEAFIDGGRPLCRLEECSFGNFMTDAMASEMKVDIAVANSGSIKGSFQKGNKRGLGWYSGKKLDFHPSNPGSTPTRVIYHKKNQNHQMCLNNNLESQGVL